MDMTALLETFFTPKGSLDAFVLENPNAKTSPQAVIADIAATFPFAPPVTLGQHPKTGAPKFHFGAVTVDAGIIPMPMPEDHLKPAYRASWLWPNAEEELRDHSATLTLAATGGEKVLDRLLPLTMVAAAIVGTCPQALGVFWDAADHLVKGKVFRDFAAQQLPGELPLLLWIGIPTGKNQDGTSSAYTVGLKQFDLPEIETNDSPASVPNLRQRFNEVAKYLITKSPEIPDGAIIGQSATETITVSYGESQFGLKGQVMRLRHKRKAPTPRS